MIIYYKTEKEKKEQRKNPSEKRNSRSDSTLPEGRFIFYAFRVVLLLSHVDPVYVCE